MRDRLDAWWTGWLERLGERIAAAACRLEAKNAAKEINLTYRLMYRSGRLDLMMAINEMDEEGRG